MAIASTAPRSPSSGAKRLIEPVSAWAWVPAAAVLTIFAGECAVEAGTFGSASGALDAEAVTYLSLMWAAAGIALWGAFVRRDLGGWGLIALGLVATAIADTYFQFWVDPVEGPY